MQFIYKGMSKRGEAPLFYLLPPLLFKGEGDKGGEVDKKPYSFYPKILVE